MHRHVMKADACGEQGNTACTRTCCKGVAVVVVLRLLVVSCRMLAAMWACRSYFSEQFFPLECLPHYASVLLLCPQVLACIGEQFDEGEEVCGVTVNIRNGKDRLELWSKTAANEALQMSIGKQLKQMLDIPDSNKIGFVVFVST